MVGHLSDPVLNDNEILITVKACGVNFPDTLIIEDKYQFKPRATILSRRRGRRHRRGDWTERIGVTPRRPRHRLV